MSLKIKSNPALIISLALILLGLAGCSAIKELTEHVQEPRLSVTDVKMTGFDFSGVDMAFDVTVDNPNALSARVVSYDYSLGINEQRLVGGRQNTETRIEASGQSTFQIPVRVEYGEVYSTIKSLAGSDQAAYDFKSTFTFDLPVLGKTEVPVNKSGAIPLLHLPKVRVNRLKVDKLSLSSADLTLQLEFDNPNGIGFDIKNFDYSLNINGSQWAEGQSLEGVTIKQKDTAQLDIPIQLNIAQMGISAFNLLTGANNLDYELKGNFTLDALHPLLGVTSFDIDREGKVELVGGE